MPNDKVQVDKIEGDAQISQIKGDVQGDVTGRDKNVYNIQHLTVYVSSRPTETKSQRISAVDIGPNPYKGLSAFQENDAERFFGRERVTQALWEKFCALHELTPQPPLFPREGEQEKGRKIDLKPPSLLKSKGGFPEESFGDEFPLRLLAILGPSGSGKSSVARAGLLPELAKHPLPGKQQARVAVFTPGTRPLEALATILARIATNDPTPVAKKLEFTEVLKQTPDGQCEGLRHIADVLPDIDTQPLILLIDQFEEIYSKEVTPEERRLFLDNLLCAAADTSGHVSIILTLRSDFLGQTQSYPKFNKAIANNEVLIPVMDEAELRDAIAKPAENAGHALDDPIVDLLIEQTRDREGALPLLQFALTKIWDGLADGVAPADTLKQIGGVGGALAGEAQRLFDRLSETDQAIARRAFLALVRLGEGTRDTRRRISLNEIVAHGEEPAHVQAVIRCFADPRARLVTLSASAEGTEIAEVTHEALLDHWETLKEWLDDNREDLRFHRHLAQDAAYWEDQNKADGLLWRPPDLDLLSQYHQRAGQDMTPLQVEFFEASVRKERHSKQIRRVVTAAIVMLAVLMSVAAGVAWWAYRRANAQTEEANKQKAEAFKQKEEADKQKAEAEHQARISLIRSVVAYAYDEDFQHNRERAALLARQASLLNQGFKGDVGEQIEHALQAIFRTSSIEEGYGYDAKGETLLDMVCESVDNRDPPNRLTDDEWEQFVGTNIKYEPACPDPDPPDMLQLRTDSMMTTDMEALSLNLREDSGYGYPIVYIENDFEPRTIKNDKVVIDHATGLMWQKPGSPDELLRSAPAPAQMLVKELNDQNFAGYDDWRLPTVEELLSLVVEPPRPNDLPNGFLYINSIFKKLEGMDWHWIWSTDFRQKEDETSSAWAVNFYTGYVRWGYLRNDNDDYVRNDDYVLAVRSWSAP